MTTHSKLQVQARAAGAEIIIFGEVGTGTLTASEVDRALKTLGSVKHITLRINSPGGDVFQGNAIFNMLQRHPATKTVYIEGLAASMASLIAMVGQRVIMPENAMMMIHDPSGLVVGNAADMQSTADVLNRIAEGMVGNYAAKSGQTPEKVRQMMRAETWLTAEEAVALGFANEVEKPVRLAAFDVSMYAHAPPSLSGTARSLDDIADRVYGRKPPVTLSPVPTAPAPKGGSAVPELVKALDTADVYARWNGRGKN